MKVIRIIPRLDIKGPNLVKGIHLEGLRVLGKPEWFARSYYEMGADELIYMDVVASLYERNSLHDIVTRTAQETSIPLTVGGGLRTVEDIRTVLRAGADKVALNTAAVRNPGIIREASREFGSSTIVVTIESIRQPDGRWLAYTDAGREHTGLEVCSWARRVEELGAGEILLTSVDRDGTGLGYDVPLVRMVAEAVGIPVIAHGGAGTLRDIAEVITEGKADAVCLASVLHYGMLGGRKTDEGLYEAEGNIEHLRSGRCFTKIRPVALAGVRAYLREQGIECRDEAAGTNRSKG